MQRHGGVSRYFAELTAAMTSLGGFEAVVPSFFTDNQYLPNKRTFLTSRPFKGKVRLMRALNRFISSRSLNSSYDLFHPTYFNPYFLSLVKSPFVLTVHDMIHHLFSGDHVRDDGTRSNMQVLCKEAARIVAVSQATKDDLCRLLDVPDSKVSVIHHGNNLCYQGENRIHLRRYVLYVGERGGYKNFRFSSFITCTPPATRRFRSRLCRRQSIFQRREGSDPRLGSERKGAAYSSFNFRPACKPLSFCDSFLLSVAPRGVRHDASGGFFLRMPRSRQLNTFF